VRGLLGFRSYLALRLRSLVSSIKGVGKICVMMLGIGLMAGLKVGLGVFAVVASRSFLSVRPV